MDAVVHSDVSECRLLWPCQTASARSRASRCGGVFLIRRRGHAVGLCHEGVCKALYGCVSSFQIQDPY